MLPHTKIKSMYKWVCGTKAQNKVIWKAQAVSHPAFAASTNTGLQYKLLLFQQLFTFPNDTYFASRAWFLT